MKSFFYFFSIIFLGCNGTNNSPGVVYPTDEAAFRTVTPAKDTLQAVINNTDTLPPQGALQWKQPYPAEAIIAYAKTLIGTPYLYASTDPQQGFDCSGFITHVFNHFGFIVPRSSVDFTNKGTPVPVQQALPGDLILFTGTDSASHTVGHMGIVLDNSGDSLHFIHSSSGRANGVTISPLQGYYEKRFVKIISIQHGL